MPLFSGTGVRDAECEERRGDMETFIFLFLIFPGSHFCSRKGPWGVRNVLVERQGIGSLLVSLLS